MGEDMEDLVQPLSYKPNMETTTKTLKITVASNVTDVAEEDIRELLAPDVPLQVALWRTWRSGEVEFYAHFETNAEAVSARQRDGALVNGVRTKIRYTVD